MTPDAASHHPTASDDSAGSIASATPLVIALGTSRSEGAAISVYLPERSIHTGTGLLICPGGGYGALSIDCEGHDVARWFAARGLTAIVLTYRLPHTAGCGHATPLEDAHAAMRLVRTRASQWGIRPDRLGILGFSAGGHLASTVGTRFDQVTRPDFMLLIYAVISMGVSTHSGSRRNLLGEHASDELVRRYSSELHVTAQTPPTFLAHANDDAGVSPLNSVNFYLALHAAGVSAELHVYQCGDHGMRGGVGYGIGEGSRSVASTWPLRAMEWMRQRGVLPT